MSSTGSTSGASSQPYASGALSKTPQGAKKIHHRGKVISKGTRGVKRLEFESLKGRGEYKIAKATSIFERSVEIYVKGENDRPIKVKVNANSLKKRLGLNDNDLEGDIVTVSQKVAEKVAKLTEKLANPNVETDKAADKSSPIAKNQRSAGIDDLDKLSIDELVRRIDSFIESDTRDYNPGKAGAARPPRKLDATKNDVKKIVAKVFEKDIFSLLNTYSQNRLIALFNNKSSFNSLLKDSEGDSLSNQVICQRFGNIIHYTSNPDVVERLAEAGVDLNSLSDSNTTILYRAVQTHNVKLVECLRNLKADPRRGTLGQSSFELAVESHKKSGENLKIHLNAILELHKLFTNSGSLREPSSIDSGSVLDQDEVGKTLSQAKLVKDEYMKAIQENDKEVQRINDLEVIMYILTKE